MNFPVDAENLVVLNLRLIDFFTKLFVPLFNLSVDSLKGGDKCKEGNDAHEETFSKEETLNHSEIERNKRNEDTSDTERNRVCQ